MDKMHMYTEIVSHNFSLCCLSADKLTVDKRWKEVQTSIWGSNVTNYTSYKLRWQTGAVEQEVTKSVMVGSRQPALSPPHVYYSQPLVGPRLGTDSDRQLLLRHLSARQLAGADTLNKTVIAFHWLSHKIWPLNSCCHQMQLDTGF